MNTYIFVWNPEIWDWYCMEDGIRQIEQSGKTEERWGSGNTKSTRPGGRVVKLGTNSQSSAVTLYCIE
jgi:hypothetical protein